MCGRNSSNQISFNKDECLINKEGHEYIPYFRKYINHNVKFVNCGSEQTYIYTIGCKLLGYGNNNNDNGKLGVDDKVYYDEVEIKDNYWDIVDIIGTDKISIIIYEK
jgi:hypothetical protein